jgi:ECF transporter S component (folate family)
VWGAVIGVASDLLGMLLFPTASFFAGFTLSALLEGLIYGLFLYNRPVNKWLYLRLALCLLALHIFIQLGLTTLWLSIMYKQAFIPMMIGRVLTNVIRFPIELAALGFLMTVIEEPVNKYYRADFSAGNDDDAIDSTDQRSDDKDE